MPAVTATATTPRPTRAESARINLYVPITLRDALAELAREGNRPIARECRAALREYVERHRREGSRG